MFTLHRLREHSQSVYPLQDVTTFPVLRSRNFWCIQRHQATAHHYDLRLHLDGCLVSWAIPKGVLGFTEQDREHLAVETPLHHLRDAVREGPEGHPGSGKGTLLWDVGRYTIQEGGREETPEHDDEQGSGAFDEEKLRWALSQINNGQRHAFHFVLHSGRKIMNNCQFICVKASYLLVLPRDRKPKYRSDGSEVRDWLLTLPTGSKGYSWGENGAEDQMEQSVKTGRSFAEICTSS